MFALLVGLAGALRAAPADEISTKVPQARAILDAWQAKDPEAVQKKLHIVYWTPSDREPSPRYAERLGAILENIRDFYSKEMRRLGFGPRTIRLDYGDDGKMKVHLVKGRQPYSHYEVQSGGEIRNECLTTLRAAGIDPERETIVIFCNMSNWDPAKRTISQNSPYYASGSNRQGTAWQVDSPILDLDSLAAKEPRVKDGQYGDISIGRYNSIFIGGVCHELGHALSLPHNKQRPDEQEAFGTALMGSGNRSYGEDLRGEGKGSFLTLAHGLRLASHPIFCGSGKGIDLPANAVVDEVKIHNLGQSFTLSGRVTANPPAYAVIGYMDPEGGGDYDATTCTAIPDGEGRFTLEANALAAGKAGVLRLVVCQANGAANSFASATSRIIYPYKVAKNGHVDLSAVQAQLELVPLINALDGSADEVGAALSKIESGGADPVVLETARVLAESARFQAGPAPAQAEGELCHLPDAAMKSSRVGYGRFTPNRLPEGMLFICESKLFPRGLYAHARSSHVWDLGGKWQSLSGHAGFPDVRRGGSCVFVVLADGKELWRSPKTEPGSLRPFKVDVSGVQSLELRVEDAGDGISSDWGCWFDPQLRR
ncbi:NPCBM/NEW2 domain-containing protein [Luteolibacter marinus]|uniref:NPCBM/NEW2 domain-containing protein n=1 Tax=Luteolibacter marinus TaxID=2776705 RepID=UPI0031B9B95C